MTCEAYWATLTDAQKTSFHASMDRASELGHDGLRIDDAYDIWALIDGNIRGAQPMPVEG